MLEKFQGEILQSIVHTDKNRIILMWNEKDEVVFITKSFESYFTMSIHDVLNTDWAVIFPDYVVQQIKKHFKTTSQSKHIPHLVIPSPRKNERFCFSTKIKQLTFNNEKHYMCILDDVTENVLLKDKLYTIEKANLTRHLSANVVHEIRNPITSIKGFLQLLEAGIDRREEYVQVLLSEIDKIERLTNQLLQISNPNKKEKRFVYIGDLLTDVLLLINAQTKMKKIVVDIIGDVEESIYCNPEEIKQVLINLIINAAEAMDYIGEIKININRLSDSIAIEVVDKGHGMSEGVVKKINEEFYTTKEDGTGLGLVVTEQIIANHNGQLYIHSSENVGSTFEIVLPLKPA